MGRYFDTWGLSRAVFALENAVPQRSNVGGSKGAVKVCVCPSKLVPEQLDIRQNAHMSNVSECVAADGQLILNSVEGQGLLSNHLLFMMFNAH